MLSPDLILAHSDWSLPALTALLAGLLYLDETSVLQSWLGQPLPAALLTGLLWGRPEIGLAVGFPLQMVFIGNLPVGQSFIGDPVVATVGVTAAACRGQLIGLVLPAAGGGSALALWGWMLLGAGLLSLAGHWLVQAERLTFGLWMHEGRLSLRDGDPGRMERLHKRCLAVTFLRGGTFAIIYSLLIQELWLRLFKCLNGPLLAAVALLPFILSGLGIGTLVERFGFRRCWWWVAAGAGGFLLLLGVFSP